MEIIGDALLAVLLAYVLAGVAFAIRFVTAVASRVNERARFGSPYFRMILAPGAILLWPWLWQREKSTSQRGKAGDEEIAE